MKIVLKSVKIIETEAEFNPAYNLYVIVMRVTNRDGSQYISSVVTENYKGNPPRYSDREVEVVAVFEYRISEKKQIPAYEVYGDGYIVPVGV